MKTRSVCYLREDTVLTRAGVFEFPACDRRIRIDADDGYFSTSLNQMIVPMMSIWWVENDFGLGLTRE